MNETNICKQQADFVKRSLQFKQEYFDLCKKYEVTVRFEPRSEFQIVDVKDWEEKLTYEQYREKFIPNWRNVPSSGWNDTNEGWYYQWLDSGHAKQQS